MANSLMVPVAITPNKEKQQKDAQDMFQQVVRNAERSNTTVPDYEFLELIGKGGSGRVYKCRNKGTGDVVAVKTINIDSVDYQSHVLERDDTLKSFEKEVSVLQKLKESKAKAVVMDNVKVQLDNLMKVRAVIYPQLDARLHDMTRLRWRYKRRLATLHKQPRPHQPPPRVDRRIAMHPQFFGR